MKLVAFSVQNYRSIKSTPRLELTEMTVLVGPNNEGKSNLLNALICALRLAQDAPGGNRQRLSPRRLPYNYDRDFPVSLREGSSETVTKFSLEFELDDLDNKSFKEATGSVLNSTLPIEISVSESGETKFTVKKQGPVQKALQAKRSEIARFIAERLQFEYIGAVRSEQHSQAIVDEMVFKALVTLESNEEYKRALSALEAAERPMLLAVSKAVENSLRPFLGSLRGVSTQVVRDERIRALRKSVEIWLDDGTSTPLSQKGDGIKSLVAIALAKAAAEGSAGNRNLILVIEEPEAHLHSGAVHSLRALLEDIAKVRQVIISTHEPALVRRDQVSTNILIEKNKAKPASKLDEIRRVLGVQLTENLVSPELVVLVEGPNDASLLKNYVSATDNQLHKLIKSERLVFRALHGAGNLHHQLRFYQGLVCNTIAFLDDDLEGNAAFVKARKDGLLEDGVEFCSKRPGASESELEDLLDPNVYAQKLCEILGVSSIKPKGTRSTRFKWSARIETVLGESGKPTSDHNRLIARAKSEVNKIAVENLDKCFLVGLRGPIDALVGSIRAKMNVHSTDEK